jgi:hypothetical protein
MKLNLRNHIIFWLIAIAFLTGVFGIILENFAFSFYFASLLLPIAVGTSYFFNFYLIPRYLFKKRYGKFSLYFLYLLIISVWLEMWVIIGSFIFLADLNYSNLAPAVTNIFVLAIVLYFIVFLNAFLLLLKWSFTMQKKSKRLKIESDKFRKGYITVKANRRQAKILFEDIIYIESMGDYIKIITNSDTPVITYERISHINKELPGRFMRIHRSFIVNSQKVNYFSKTNLQINNNTLPISRTYKKEVFRELSSNSSNS